MGVGGGRGRFDRRLRWLYDGDGDDDEEEEVEGREALALALALDELVRGGVGSEAKSVLASAYGLRTRARRSRALRPGTIVLVDVAVSSILIMRTGRLGLL